MQRREGAPQRAAGEDFGMREQQQPERRGSIVVALVGIPSARRETVVDVFVGAGYVPFEVNKQRDAADIFTQGPDIGAKRILAEIKTLEETRGKLKALVTGLDHPDAVKLLQDKGAGVIGVTASDESLPQQKGSQDGSVDSTPSAKVSALDVLKDRSPECVALADVVVKDTGVLFPQELYKGLKSLEEQEK